MELSNFAIVLYPPFAWILQFLHATGYQAQLVNLPNFHNAFASIYEGRYLAGVAAGLKLQRSLPTTVLLKPITMKTAM